MRLTLLENLKSAVILWLARLLPDCKTITPMLSRDLDRKTTLSEKIRVRLHLFACEACERYLNQIAFLKEAAQIHGEKVDESEECSMLGIEARHRLKDVLRSRVGLA